MFSYRKLAGLMFALVCAAIGATSYAQTQKYSPVSHISGMGRTATPTEVSAWDIDVRPDFKGLPKGAGSVVQGEKIWEAQCASCHGAFAESNQVFFTLVGYTNKKDVDVGRVASLQLMSDVPYRTMMMKLSTVSTLWDYINRAMPWTAPKSLKPDEVFAVTAYLLNLANVVPDDFVLTDKNIAEVQKLIPNRSGMTTKHAMWPGTELGGVNGLKAKPDTQGSNCMRDCPVDPKVGSAIPAYAMNAHGNLAEQNRPIGGVRGLDTSKPRAEVVAVDDPPKAASDKAIIKTKTSDMLPILQKNTCSACHAVAAKVMGPAFKEVAKKYANRSDAASYLAGKIKSGGAGVWGSIPMPPMNISDAESKKIAQWLSQGSVD
jgi:S-disulfanyl-L-cysteine oxidoreductase SoxD